MARPLDTLPVEDHAGHARLLREPLAGLRVLVVDDNEKVGGLTRRILARSCDATAVRSGTEAVALFEAGRRFDVILCDVTMPGMSGIDLYQWLEGRAPAQARRVVFTTGGAFTAKTRDFLARCSNPKLTKPYRLADLWATVKAVARQEG